MRNLELRFSVEVEGPESGPQRVDALVQVSVDRGVPQKEVPGQACHMGAITVSPDHELGPDPGNTSSLDGMPTMRLTVTVKQTGEKIENSIGTSQIAV